MRDDCSFSLPSKRFKLKREIRTFIQTSIKRRFLYLLTSLAEPTEKTHICPKIKIFQTKIFSYNYRKAKNFSCFSRKS